MTARVIVCGSRSWRDRQAISNRLYSLVTENGWRYPEPVIVHGKCPRGADRLCDEEAGKAGLLTEPHPADWDGYTAEDFKRFGRKGAGRKRNEEMAELGAVLCIAFWDGRSTGTKDMIERATRHGIPTEIVYPASL
jgi:hypothetical protein